MASLRLSLNPFLKLIKKLAASGTCCSCVKKEEVTEVDHSYDPQEPHAKKAA